MTNMPHISAFVITYNEENNIGQCLETLNWADEILVVDSFSEDRTAEIADRYADRIIEHEFEGHVGQTRFAAEHSYPNGMRDIVATSTKYAWYAAQSRFDSGRQYSLLSMMLKPAGNFLKQYLLQLGFLDGMPGFAIAVRAGYYRFMREVMMWELEHAPPDDVS